MTSVLIPQSRRPGTNTSLGNHEARLRALERTVRTLMGILCNNLNQCEWFSLQTSGEIPSTDQGIEITVLNGKDFDITMVDGGNFGIDGGGGFIFVNTGIAQLSTSAATFQTDANGVTSRLQAGKRLLVEDSTGNPILRVDEAGTYHIKTGAAWVADL